jgi:hypothetical protein
MNEEHVAQNRSQLQRLRALVARATDADLALPLPAGWTVAASLAHVAFWDQRAMILLDRWEQQGVAPSSIVPGDVDWINDSAKVLCLALPPRTAAQLAIRVAEAVDARIEALSQERIAANRAAGNPIRLLRAEHRREHLSEIEHALAARG